MQDAWRAYLELALGLTEASRRKAEQVARDVVGKGGATAAQVQAFVDDLVSTSRANREGLAKLVRYEVERALGAVGLATADEVADLTARVRKLERELKEAGPAGAPAGVTTPAPPATRTTTARKTPAKAAAAAKAPARKAAKATAKKTVRKQPAKKATRTPQARG